MTAAAHTPESVSKNVAARQENAFRAAQLEAAGVYKEDHGVGKRAIVETKVVYVYLRPDRKKPAPAAESLHWDRFLNDAEEQWLRTFVRVQANTKKGSKFLDDFVMSFNSKFNRNLAKTDMSCILRSMGIVFGKLKSDYYFRAFSDPYNVERRNLITPVLYYLLTSSSSGLPVVVWSFDESAFYIDDHVSMGWYDTTQPLEERRNSRNPGKGARFSVSAFLSAEFGVLVDEETGEHVGALELRGTNTIKSTAALMDLAGRVLCRQYPNFFHVISLDSARIHASLPSDACIPSKINVSDNGANRGNDRLFGKLGLTSIFQKFFPDDQIAGLKKSELQERLWEKECVQEQKLLLEEVLGRHGVGMLFNPIAHPIVAPIELLWRDMKWDYKCHWEHKQSELETCLRAWLANATDPVDSELASSYFRKSRAFVVFYLRGGTGKSSERDVSRWQADQF